VPSPYQRICLAPSLPEKIDLSVSISSRCTRLALPDKDLRRSKRYCLALFSWATCARTSTGLFQTFRLDFVVLSSFTSVTGQCSCGGYGASGGSFGRAHASPTGAKRLISSNWLHRLRELRHCAIGAPPNVTIGVVSRTSAISAFPITATGAIPCDSARCRRAPLTFLFCGQMIERKGVDVLLLALIG